MIIRIHLECVRGPFLLQRCLRLIELAEDTSLNGVHEVIQESVGFDRNHFYAFFQARHEHVSRRGFFFEWDRWEEAFEAFSQLTIADVYPPPAANLRLFYVFPFQPTDRDEEWLFRIKRGRKRKPPEPGVLYPREIERIGPNPLQYGVDWEDED